MSSMDNETFRLMTAPVRNDSQPKGMNAGMLKARFTTDKTRNAVAVKE